MSTDDVSVKKNSNSILANIILKKLNSGEDIENAHFDARQVANGFITSKVCFLHDGDFKKTVFVALHIPNANEEGRIHSYVVNILKYKRIKKSEPWEINYVERLEQTEVQKLFECLQEQNQFVGYKPDNKYFKILSSEHPGTLKDINYIANSLVRNRVSLESNDKDLNELLKNVVDLLDGNSVAINQEVYNRLLRYRTNSKSIKNYECDLKTFKNLIDSTTSTETDMQNFLESKIWLFGLNYNQSKRYSISQFNSSLGNRYDFLLEGFNQVYDIAELKGPNEPMFEVESSAEKSDRVFDERIDYRLSKKFGRALHQVTCYVDEFERHFELIQSHQPSIKPFLYPHGIIVMSKRSLFSKTGHDSDRYLHLLNRQFANIDILTYDDLYDRGMIILDFLKSIESGRHNSEEKIAQEMYDVPF